MNLTRETGKELVLEIIVFCGGIATISLFYMNNFLLTALLIILWAIGIKFWHKKHDLYIFVTGAIIGSIAEIFCIHFGAWQYTNPTFLGIPSWLPFGWGILTMLIKRIAETLVKIETK